jgi:hypothetical protein
VAAADEVELGMTVLSCVISMSGVFFGRIAIGILLDLYNK